MYFVYDSYNNNNNRPSRKTERGSKLREVQAGFRQHRCCNFMDFKKAFHSVDRDTLWKILRHRAIPEKLVNITKCQYEASINAVIDGGGITEPLTVKTGTRQGYMLSPFLSFLAIDWVTRQSMDNKGTGIRFISGRSLEDLESADDLAS